MSELTFGALAEAYLTDGLRNRPSQEEYVTIYRRHFKNPEWAGQPLGAISRFQVMKLNQQLASMPAQGNKIVAFIKRVYSWGMDTINPETDRPYWEGQNPAWRITRHDCYARERVMDRSEITLLLQTIDYLSPKYQAFFLCRLLVPGRIKELCTMRRDSVTADGKWTKGKTKNGRPHVIYVARQAIALLSALPVEGEYFFMGHYSHPLTGGAVRKMWARWRQHLGMTDLWLLDFRRTLATYLYRVLKVDDLTAKAVLNHYDGRPVAIYVRLDFDYLATILQRYADWIWSCRHELPHDAPPSCEPPLPADESWILNTRPVERALQADRFSALQSGMTIEEAVSPSPREPRLIGADPARVADEKEEHLTATGAEWPG